MCTALTIYQEEEVGNFVIRFTICVLIDFGSPLQIRIQFVRQRFDPTLETNKDFGN